MRKSSTSNQEFEKFVCEWISIGNHKYAPRHAITMSSNEIQIVVPSVADESKEVPLKLNMKHVVKVFVYRGVEGALVFIKVDNKCGIRIRSKLLGITQPALQCSGRSSESTPANYLNNQITLFLSTLADEIVIVLKRLFGSSLIEISSETAFELLAVKSEHVQQLPLATITDSSATAPEINSKEDPAKRNCLFIYPFYKGGINVYESDLDCLKPDKCLNDVIVDLFLKHTNDQLSPDQRKRTHIFNSIFYTRLVLTLGPKLEDSDCLIHEGYLAVKKWTQNKNIFLKDFIVVPINQYGHWSVAIICFPAMIVKRMAEKPTNTEPQPSNIDGPCGTKLQIRNIKPRSFSFYRVLGSTKIRELLNRKPTKRPCILLFNSMPSKNPSKIFNILRQYLTYEYETKMSKSEVFTEDNMPGIVPKVPMHYNHNDAGLYMLQYVEQFFKDPILDYNMPIRNLEKWFKQSVIRRKREDISNVMNTMKERYNPNSYPYLTLKQIYGF